MAQIRISKSDLIWSYTAQLLSIGTGVITLPFILNKLSASEIGLNYILITIAGMVALVDLGFSPQFARNFTYVFSGVQEIKKEGIGESGVSINYNLLTTLIISAKYLYMILGLMAFLILIVIGTPYVYHVTNGFSIIPNAIWVWVIYSLGIVFQVYFSYYTSLLIGRGMIKVQKQSMIATKLLQISILLILLYADCGLLSVSVAQLVSPFLGRYILYKAFFTKEILNNISPYINQKWETVKNVFFILWHNAKRDAIMNIGAYAVVQIGVFIAGLFLSLSEFASYGLMLQLANIIGTVSSTVIAISQPRYSSLRASGNSELLLKDFAKGMVVFYALFVLGSLILISYGSEILLLIKSNATLPSKFIVTIYCMIFLLEKNHACFALLISTDNRIPFAPASLITGFFICLGSYVVIYNTDWGILGLILVQGICQLVYQNWKWPYMALSEFNTNYFSFLRIGILEWRNKIRNII